MYDKIHPESLDQYYINKLFIKTISQISKDKPVILDIGCGTGNYAKYFIRCFPNGILWANDISGEMLKVFKSKIKANPYVRFLPMPVERLFNEFPEINYDIVCAEGSLHHLEYPAKIIEKITEHLNAGGVIIIFSEPFLNLKKSAMIPRYIDNILIALISGRVKFKTLKGKILSPFLFLGSLIFSRIYKLMCPEKYKIIVESQHNLLLKDDKVEKMLSASETHGNGIDKDLIKKVLSAQNMKIIKEQNGAGYYFYLSYLLSYCFGATHFSLVAVKQ
ncbi:MAG: class I SAM-dependent methyltransferase [Nitrospirota bacterium]